MKNYFFLFFLTIALLSACSPKPSPTSDESKDEEIITALPMKQLDLSALLEQNPGWSAASSIRYDLRGAAEVQSETGTGLLVSQGAEDGSASLLNTGIDHQDLDLELEFLLSEASTVELLFQGKYLVKLNDSWNNDQPFCGSIAGQTPSINAVKAPGLWQQFSASFHAPDFDEEGNKIADAYLSDVLLNGMPIFNKISLSEDEPSQTGPFQVQASANTAIRDLRYKKYGTDSLRLENIRYEVFFGDWDVLPDFSALEVADQGEADFIDVSVAGQADKYALKFYGDLFVPTEGEYFIQSTIDDGGDIFINGELVLHNDGEPNVGTEQTIATLPAGQHDFEMTYFQDHWGAVALIRYEGPEMAMQSLAADPRTSRWLEREPPTLPLTELKAPELLRCFADYGDEKRTHVMAVGIPEGPHYLYDLEQMALLKTWRGDFADVAEMWINRGERQLMKPLNAAIELSDGLPVAEADYRNKDWPKDYPTGLKRIGYEINQADLPVFKYQMGNQTITDQLEPAEQGNSLIRRFEKEGNTELILQLAQGQEIAQLDSGLYCIDGQYYLEIIGNSDAYVHDGQSLRAVLGDTPLSYQIIW
jgi:hypothetical protein